MKYYKKEEPLVFAKELTDEYTLNALKSAREVRSKAYVYRPPDIYFEALPEKGRAEVTDSAESKRQEDSGGPRRGVAEVQEGSTSANQKSNGENKKTESRKVGTKPVVPHKSSDNKEETKSPTPGGKDKQPITFHIKMPKGLLKEKECASEAEGLTGRLQEGTEREGDSQVETTAPANDALLPIEEGEVSQEAKLEQDQGVGSRCNEAADLQGMSSGQNPSQYTPTKQGTTTRSGGEIKSLVRTRADRSPEQEQGTNKITKTK